MSNFATIKQRILSLLIDYAVLLSLMYLVGNHIMPFILGCILGLSGLEMSDSKFIETIDNNIVPLMLIFAFFYYGHPFKKSGQTLGERIMKIKVVPLFRKRIGFIRAIIRTAFLAPLLAIMGLIPITKDPPRTILDYICSTYTTRVEKD